MMQTLSIVELGFSKKIIKCPNVYDNDTFIVVNLHREMSGVLAQ